MATKRKPTSKQAVVYNDFVAGVKYYDIGDSQVRVGDRLKLFWEQGNVRDNQAIRVETVGGTKLGYVKGADTAKLHWYRERGVKLTTTVAGYFPSNTSWEMLRIRVTAPNAINVEYNNTEL